MIKFINLPDSFNLVDVKRILYEEKLEITVVVSTYSGFKISSVPYSSRLLVRQFFSLSSDSEDFISLDGYAVLSDVFKLLKNLKFHEYDKI